MNARKTVARTSFVVGLLASCGISVSLTHTVVVPLLPIFPAALGTSPSTTIWLVTATLLAGAVLSPVFGRLGDMYGKRRMLLVALGSMGLGSAVAAVAWAFPVLLAGRVLQGAAMGVIPLGISILRDTLPPAKVASGVALMSSSLGVGGAVGLPVCGLVAEGLGWQALFAGSAVLTLLQWVAVYRILPESPVRSGGRFDVVGALGLSVALVCLLLAISRGNVWGWTSATTLGLLAATAVVLALWGLHEVRTAAPLVDLRVNRRPALLLTNVVSVLLGFALFTGFLLAPQVLQAPIGTGYGFERSLVATGLLLVPGGLMMLFFSPVSAGLTRRHGARTTLVLGAGVLAVGHLAWPWAHTNLVSLVLQVTLTSIGSALAYAALPSLVMDAVPVTETAAANSLNSLMRTLGTTVSSAVVAAISGAWIVEAAGQVFPAEFAVTLCFLLAGGIAALAALGALLIPAGRAPRAAATARGAVGAAAP